MNGPITPDHIDPVIHERVRLSIVSTLAMVQEMSFKERKERRFNVDALTPDEVDDFLKLSEMWRERGFG